MFFFYFKLQIFKIKWTDYGKLNYWGKNRLHKTHLIVPFLFQMSCISNMFGMACSCGVSFFISLIPVFCVSMVNARLLALMTTQIFIISYIINSGMCTVHYTVYGGEFKTHTNIYLSMWLATYWFHWKKSYGILLLLNKGRGCNTQLTHVHWH